MGRRIFGTKMFWFSAAGVLIVSALIFGSSVYAKSVLTPAENVSLWVAFPVGKVTKPMTVANPSGGKVFVKPVTIDIQQQGALKRFFDHWSAGFSTHWVVNVGKKTQRVALRVAGDNIPVEWHARTGFALDEETGAFSKTLKPGEQVPNLVMDWSFKFPENIRSKPVLYNGALIVSDADSGEMLSTFPIKIVNGGTP